MSHELYPIKTVVVPGWIYRAVLNNKLNIIDLADYSKMRSILSRNDLVEWTVANNPSGFLFPDLRLSNYEMFSQTNVLTDEQRLELSNLPLSGDKTVVENLKTRLSSTNDTANARYRFICTTDTIYIVLDEGFVTTIAKDDNKLVFIKEYLRNCYSLMPIIDVSWLPIFNTYINLLAKTASL